LYDDDDLEEEEEEKDEVKKVKDESQFQSWVVVEEEQPLHRSEE
jgi:hypothetical protein